MSSKVKGFKAGRGKIRHAIKAKSKSARAGLNFPVARISTLLKKGKYCERVGVGTSIYLSAVMEYLAAEILELSANAAKDHKKQRIIPRHIELAIRNDVELSKVFQGVTISSGGVMPNIHQSLFPQNQKQEVKGEN